MKETAYRIFSNHNPPRGEIFPQFPDRPVRLLRNQRTDQIAMRLKMRAAMTAILIGRNIAAGALALSPAHNSRNAKIKPGSNDTATVTCLKRRNNTLAKIKRIRSNHHMLASFPSQHVESELNRIGNPKSIQSIQLTL